MDKNKATGDFYCLGSCMSYCDECKWEARWKEVGEFTLDERMAKWPTLVRINDSQCQLLNGAMFKPAKVTS